MSGNGKRPTTDGADFATIDIINEARRPLLIARHRQLVTEMEAGLADAYVNGRTEHPRMVAMLRDLASESEVQRIQRTLKLLSEEEHYRDLTVQAALTEYLCLMREEGSVEIAALQMHAIGVYRTIRGLLEQAQGPGEGAALDELRELPATAIGQLLDPPAQVFGRLGTAPVRSRGFSERNMAAVRHLLQGERADSAWDDADAGQAVTRADEEAVRHLPEAERSAAIAFLIRDRIRSRFYRTVFLEYLSADEFSPDQPDLPPTVLAWLQVMSETPHLYPFLQGQPDRQKIYRIARLTQKLVQLFEIYARVAKAELDPTHRAQLAGRSTREQLMHLTRQHHPPLPLNHELTLAAMLCPFRAFVEFVQSRVQAGDFVLPPDPKR